MYHSFWLCILLSLFSLGARGQTTSSSENEIEVMILEVNVASQTITVVADGSEPIVTTYTDKVGPGNISGRAIALRRIMEEIYAQGWHIESTGYTAQNVATYVLIRTSRPKTR